MAIIKGLINKAEFKRSSRPIDQINRKLSYSFFNNGVMRSSKRGNIISFFSFYLFMNPKIFLKIRQYFCRLIDDKTVAFNLVLVPADKKITTLFMK